VIVECLTAAHAQQERFGVWGAVDFTHRPGRPRST